MRVRRLLPCVLTLELLLGIIFTPFQQRTIPSSVSYQPKTASARQLPLSFEVNQGQASSQVQFLAHQPGYTLYLTPQESLLALDASSSTLSALSGPAEPDIAAPSLLTSAALPTLVGMQFLNANPHPKIIGQDPLPGIVNYLVGNNPALWHTNIPTFAQVRYQNIYPGIDLLYDGSRGSLEYDFLVAPGSDPSQIHLSFSGVQWLSLDAQGELLLHLPNGSLPEAAPRVYQVINGRRQQVASSYSLQGAAKVGFALGTYDASQPLVIDPAVLFATYLGGAKNDYSTGLAMDSQGNVYITGATDSTNFPTQNPLQSAFGGGPSDVFVTKVNAGGTALLYSTYLGGSGADWGTGIAVDSAGNASITGGVSSTNFPLQHALQASERGTANAFVTRLNPQGSALAYSTYLGGSTYDVASGIALDNAGDAYVTGVTHSSNFPTQNALHSTYGGGGDAFVTKVNAAGSALVYSTYLGGSRSDWGTGITVDSQGNAYITGSTSSTNFPTHDALYASNRGGVDAFVAEILARGNALASSSYLGGSGNDEGTGIAVASTDNSIYVAGATTSSNFPTVHSIQGYGGREEGFLLQMSLIGDPSSVSASATSVHTVTGDFNGDGIADVVSFYNYGNNQIKARLFPETSTGTFGPPSVIWDSGVNAWNWNALTFLAGDFTGDGKTDILAIHNDGGSRTTFWLFKGTGTGIAAPVQVWDSGADNFSWSRAQFVAGDFNGDGKTDVVAFYDYGNSQTKAWLWSGTTASTWSDTGPIWDSGVNSWNASQAKYLAGDFNGDGKADVMAFYNFGSAHTKAFLWPGTTTGFGPRSAVWDSGVGNFDWTKAQFVAGDFNGDGKADIVAFYDYGSAHMKAWLWPGTTAAIWHMTGPIWDSGVNNWSSSHAKYFAGDFNGDGRADVMAFYDYGSAHTKAWLWPGTTAATWHIIGPVWDSGVNNWNWSNM